MSAAFTPSQKQALNLLIMLRRNARSLVTFKAQNDALIQRLKTSKTNAIKTGDRVAQAQAQVDLENASEHKLRNKFLMIETGRTFVRWSPAIAHELPREVWLQALNVNRSEWDTAEMREEGSDPCKVVWLLRLENSASGDTPETKPLSYCFEKAFYNAMKVDKKLAEEAHAAANEIFNGALGDWQEPSTLQLCGVSA